MTLTEKGCRIRCAHCRKDFESLGLRCCSANCERSYREAQDNRAVMAEVGIEPAAKRRCANPECGAVVPKWRNGRRVSSATASARRAAPGEPPSWPPDPGKSRPGCRGHDQRFSTSKRLKSPCGMGISFEVIFIFGSHVQSLQ
jgi:hypothetical protein